jgi:uncharacterized protein DUF6916
MAEIEALTAGDFAPLLHEPFQIDPGDGSPFAVELIEVSEAESGARRRQFSLVFRGGPTPPLPQRIYAVEHERLARIELFLVPLGPDEAGQCYQAVFT